MTKDRRASESCRKIFFLPPYAQELCGNIMIIYTILWILNKLCDEIHWFLTSRCGPGQLTRYGHSLQAWRPGDRIMVWARFSVPFHNGTGVHPAPYIMVTGSFPGVKRPGRGVDHPHQSSAEIKEIVDLYIYYISGISWPVLGWPLPWRHAKWCMLLLGFKRLLK